MKVQAFLAVVLVSLVAVWAAGCAAAPTEVAPREEELGAAQGQSDEAPELEEATMTPIPTPEPAEVTPPPEAEVVVRMAVDDLTQRLSLAPEAIRLVSVQAMEWSDASLGCPQPGMMYAQVITPGYLVVLEAEGERYEYHTDMDRFAVLCEEGGEGAAPPISPPPATRREPLAVAEPPAEAAGVVRMAVEDLAGRLGLGPEAIRLVSVEAVDWPDASLGCPQPGMMYAQVITPGYRVVLEAEGKQYDYHTDQGRVVVLCEKGSRAAGSTQEEAVSGEPNTLSAQGTPYSLAGESTETVEFAKEDLARRLGIGTDSIDVVAIIGQEFSADAFYCRVTKQRIARDESPAAISGETILLSAAGQKYEYHASDETVIFCRQLP